MEGYRRLTFMMLDADIVAVSASSVWRVRTERSSVAQIARSASGQERRYRLIVHGVS